LCSMVVPLTELEQALHELHTPGHRLMKVFVSPEARERIVF